MITLNDIRKILNENDCPYEEHDNYLLVRTTTPGCNRLPTIIKYSCDEYLLCVDCRLAKPINVNLNKEVLEELNRSNWVSPSFQFVIEKTDGKYFLCIRATHLAAYVTDPKMATLMTITTDIAMENAYQRIIKANDFSIKK